MKGWNRVSKFLYILPTVLIWLFSLLFALIALLLFGFSTKEQSILPYALRLLALLGIPAILSLLGSILLYREKWWGCFFGMSFGVLPLALSASELLDSGRFGWGFFAVGAGTLVYYALMGVLCAQLRSKKALL